MDGALASNPYCEDGYLAYVARAGYGMQVTATLLRGNPTAKEDVCRAIGHDTRIEHICGSTGDSPFANVQVD